MNGCFFFSEREKRNVDWLMSNEGMKLHVPDSIVVNDNPNQSYRSLVD